jgi:hypothetical protein
MSVWDSGAPTNEAVAGSRTPHQVDSVGEPVDGGLHAEARSHAHARP